MTWATTMTSWANGRRLLFCDIETYCEVDLKTCGVFRYADDPSFEVMLFGFAYNDEDVKVIDIASGEKIPDYVLEDLFDAEILKLAHNAQFEITCLSRWLGRELPPEQWYCTAVRAATLGLPRSLEAVGDALGLPEDEKKLKIGKQLIQYFAKPCAPTKTNGGRTRNLPRHEPEKWALYKTYNIGDVATERSIYKRMLAYPDIPEREHRLWEVDQRINAAGTTVDTVLIKNIIEYGAERTEALQEEAKRISGLDNTNSMPQIKRWLRTKGIAVSSFDKDAVRDLSKTVADPDVLRFLQIRQELGKTSVAKYDAMQRALCSDGRVRGMLQFYGANRTGRWAGRIVQLQNLPRNELDDIDLPRRIVRSGDFELLELLYDSPMDVFSQLVRTAFIAGAGKMFVVADYSAIEARVIAWIAGEEWRLQAFRDGKDIYCESASQMFGVPVVKNGVNGHLRKKGKVAELACIAEGTLIQTERRGLVPIEELTELDRVFDGEQYVSHGGVLYKGTKEVITYDGLSATADHLVWIEGQSGPVPFGCAAESHARLLRPGDNQNDQRRDGKRGNPRIGEAGGSSQTEELAGNQKAVRVYDILNCGPNNRYLANGALVHNCGYQGGIGAMKRMGGEEMGLTDTEMQEIVDNWRAKSPKIVELWSKAERAAKNAILHPGTTQHFAPTCSFQMIGKHLFMTLPSGRRICYNGARVEQSDKNQFKSSIKYMGQDQESGRWGLVETYGGKLVENCIQSVARDCLGEAMIRLDDAGYRPEFHIHDEVVIPVPAENAERDLEKIADIMALEDLPWKTGLPLRADGYVTEYYKKD